MLGTVLEVIRVANFMTVKEVAEAINVSQGFIYDVEENVKTPAMKAFNKLAKFYGIERSAIVKFSEYYEKLIENDNISVLDCKKMLLTQVAIYYTMPEKSEVIK